MQDNRFFILVILLVSSISFNHGQKIKANDRRSAGMVAYPRLGRNSELASFSRSRRAFGVITVPRAGRSDPSSLDNGYRFHDLSSDADFEYYYVDPDNFLDRDYEEYANKPFKYADKMQKDGSWLMPYHVHGYKDLPVAQKIDDLRSYYSGLRGSRNTQGQGGYTPRLGRENEHDATNFL
ncbi:CAPA peptides-like isoform X2 [Linepithema humile]|uniref:CAPA peptides-like isoform X2 n=1 Tax=Linepithema humile TaxID=83485 RepID=UPI00351E97E9